MELRGRGQHSVQLGGQQAGAGGRTGGRGQTLHCQHRVQRVVSRAPGDKQTVLQRTLVSFNVLCVIFFPNKNSERIFFSDLFGVLTPNYLLSCLGRVALELEERDLSLAPWPG